MFTDGPVCTICADPVNAEDIEETGRYLHRGCWNIWESQTRASEARKLEKKIKKNKKKEKDRLRPVEKASTEEDPSGTEAWQRGGLKSMWNSLPMLTSSEHEVRTNTSIEAGHKKYFSLSEVESYKNDEITPIDITKEKLPVNKDTRVALLRSDVFTDRGHQMRSNTRKNVIAKIEAAETEEDVTQIFDYIELEVVNYIKWAMDKVKETLMEDVAKQTLQPGKKEGYKMVKRGHELLFRCQLKELRKYRSMATDLAVERVDILYIYGLVVMAARVTDLGYRI